MSELFRETDADGDTLSVDSDGAGGFVFMASGEDGHRGVLVSRKGARLLAEALAATLADE